MKRRYVKIIVFLMPVMLGVGAETFHYLYGTNHGKAGAIIRDYAPESWDEQQLEEMLTRLRGVGPVDGYFRASRVLARLALVAALMFSILAVIGKLSWKIVIVIVLDWLAAVFAFVNSGVVY